MKAIAIQQDGGDDAALGRASSRPGGDRRRTPRVALVGRIAPVAVGAIALLAILRRYPVAQIASEVRKGRALAMVPWALGLTTAYWLLGSYWDLLVLRQFRPLGYGAVARARAGTAVLTAMGYVFGSGGYGVWLARGLRVGATTAAALVAMFVLSDLSAIGLVAGIADALGGARAPRALRIAAALAALVPVVAVVVRGVAARMRRSGAIGAWLAVPRSVALVQVAGRCVNIALAVVATWYAARAFGLAIPFAAMAAYLPAVLLVGSLPVNAAGVGAVQAAWLLFFLRWESGPRILAFQFLWHAMMTAAIVLRGLPFVRSVAADISGGSNAPAQNGATAETPVHPVATRAHASAP